MAFLFFLDITLLGHNSPTRCPNADSKRVPRRRSSAPRSRHMFDRSRCDDETVTVKTPPLRFRDWTRHRRQPADEVESRPETGRSAWEESAGTGGALPPTTRQFPSSAAADAPHTCVRAAAAPPVRTFCVHDALRCCRQSRRNNHDRPLTRHIIAKSWVNPSIRPSGSWCLKIRFDLGVLSLYLPSQFA